MPSKMFGPQKSNFNIGYLVVRRLWTAFFVLTWEHPVFKFPLILIVLPGLQRLWCAISLNELTISKMRFCSLFEFSYWHTSVRIRPCTTIQKGICVEMFSLVYWQRLLSSMPWLLIQRLSDKAYRWSVLCRLSARSSSLPRLWCSSAFRYWTWSLLHQLLYIHPANQPNVPAFSVQSHVHLERIMDYFTSTNFRCPLSWPYRAATNWAATSN